VFLVGGPTADGVAEVLALTEGGGGDSAKRGEAGARVAASLTSGPGRRKEDDVNLVLYGDGGTSEQPRTLLAAKGGTTGVNRDTPMILSHALTGEGHDRRLTPLEFERLQGFPDGWTCLCQPLEAYAADPDGAALACTCPDSPRYRAMGNAVTVNVIEWLGQRLLTLTPEAR
jgi:DNA (cytosine-5)-methyltransferase 1